MKTANISLAAADRTARRAYIMFSENAITSRPAVLYHKMKPRTLHTGANARIRPPFAANSMTVTVAAQISQNSMSSKKTRMFPAVRSRCLSRSTIRAPSVFLPAPLVCAVCLICAVSSVCPVCPVCAALTFSAASGALTPYRLCFACFLLQMPRGTYRKLS
ncbi:MAG: hypothetical protein WCQ72_07290, partial [Eubacteriales bacterium]